MNRVIASSILIRTARALTSQSAPLQAGQRQPGTLPNLVAAGDVTSTTAVLWARTTVPGKVNSNFGLILRSRRSPAMNVAESVSIFCRAPRP